MENQIVIYTTSDHEPTVEVRLEQETVWLDAHSIARLFNVQRPAIVKHIGNIYKTGELDEDSTCSILEQVAADGKVRKMNFYNLDVIISVGYRVNSKKATQFRQWATQHLKDYLVQGYVINEKRFAQKQQEVNYLRTGIQILSRAIEEKAAAEGNDWLQQFARGLELLDDYDHERLDSKGLNNREAHFPELSEYRDLVAKMKAEFNSSIFGKEKDQSLESSVQQISKGFGEEDFYPTLEEKAATLLYLIIKNHAFVDGNKRIAAACFLLFLERNGLLFLAEEQPIISNDALASLTLFVAASRPEEMQTVKRLVVSVLNRSQ